LLPMQIRGFGRIKTLAIKDFEVTEKRILNKFRTQGISQ